MPNHIVKPVLSLQHSSLISETADSMFSSEVPSASCRSFSLYRPLAEPSSRCVRAAHFMCSWCWQVSQSTSNRPEELLRHNEPWTMLPAKSFPPWVSLRHPAQLPTTVSTSTVKPRYQTSRKGMNEEMEYSPQACDCKVIVSQVSERTEHRYSGKNTVIPQLTFHNPCTIEILLLRGKEEQW